MKFGLFGNFGSLLIICCFLGSKYPRHKNYCTGNNELKFVV